MGGKGEVVELESGQEAPAGLQGAPGRPEPRRRLADPKLRKWGLRAGAALLLGALGLVIYYHNRETTDDAEVDGHLVPVASKIYGNVQEVLVNDNQPVKKGQVLVRIDPRDCQAKVDQARAALLVAESQARAAHIGVPWTAGITETGSSAAEAELSAVQADNARAGLALDQASGPDLAYAQANVARRQAESDRAQADLARMKALVEKAEISRQEYDAFMASARVAESELKAAQERLASAQQGAQIAQKALAAAQARVGRAKAGVAESQVQHRQVPMRQADAESASAAVAQARANLEAAELQLSYAIITAPLDGVVTQKSAEMGQVVQPGQQLLVVVPLQDVWVTANFKETQLAKVRPGQKARIEVDMYGKTFTGRVDSVAGATGARLSLLPPENATGNYVKVVQRIPVKILLDPVAPEQAILRPGMNVVVTIITK